MYHDHLTCVSVVATRVSETAYLWHRYILWERYGIMIMMKNRHSCTRDKPTSAQSRCEKSKTAGKTLYSSITFDSNWSWQGSIISARIISNESKYTAYRQRCCSATNPRNTWRSPTVTGYFATWWRMFEFFARSNTKRVFTAGQTTVKKVHGNWCRGCKGRACI